MQQLRDRKQETGQSIKWMIETAVMDYLAKETASAQK
jgi:hypothetical protein